MDLELTKRMYLEILYSIYMVTDTIFRSDLKMAIFMVNNMDFTKFGLSHIEVLVHQITCKESPQI